MSTSRHPAVYASEDFKVRVNWQLCIFMEEVYKKLGKRVKIEERGKEPGVTMKYLAYIFLQFAYVERMEAIRVRLYAF